MLGFVDKLREKTMNEQDREFLSAYLDGELDASEAARAEQMLERDPQARAFYESIDRTRGLVQNLSPAKVPHDIAFSVSRALLRPEGRVIRMPRGLGYAIAACFVLTLGLTVYWLGSSDFSPAGNAAGGGQIAEANGRGSDNDSVVKQEGRLRRLKTSQETRGENTAAWALTTDIEKLESENVRYAENDIIYDVTTKVSAGALYSFLLGKRAEEGQSFADGYRIEKPGTPSSARAGGRPPVEVDESKITRERKGDAGGEARAMMPEEPRASSPPEVAPSAPSPALDAPRSNYAEAGEEDSDGAALEDTSAKLGARSKNADDVGEVMSTADEDMTESFRQDEVQPYEVLVIYVPESKVQDLVREFELAVEEAEAGATSKENSASSTIQLERVKKQEGVTNEKALLDSNTSAGSGSTATLSDSRVVDKLTHATGGAIKAGTTENGNALGESSEMAPSLEEIEEEQVEKMVKLVIRLRKPGE